MRARDPDQPPLSGADSGGRLYARQLARERRRRGVARLGVAITLIVIAALVCWILFFRQDPLEATASDFVTAFEEGDYPAAAALTDGEPEAVASALEANVNGLDGASLEADVLSVKETKDGARAEFEMDWDVPEIGVFSYRNDKVKLVETDGDWRVHWRDSVIHPALDVEGLRLGTTVVPPERAPILGRDGEPLVRDRAVVEIGIIPKKAGDLESAAVAVAEVTDIDAEAFADSLGAAEPENFVPAITIRREEFEPMRDELEGIDGIEFGLRELPLAPTKEFARALLGTVGPVTAEQLKKEPDKYESGEVIGQSGLQAAFDGRLGGEPTREIVVRREDGAYVETLEEVGGERGEELRTTLDFDVQMAAEEALSGVDGVAVLVALEAASGDVLAVASRPIDDSFNRALEGQYPPGSTFKVVTTAALLDAGLSTDEIVPCPQFATVGGRQFRNFEGSAAGSVPFATDFAESCNTAFVSLVDRLGPTSLREWAYEFGLGRELSTEVAAYGGSVPRMEETVDRAASMIGQGEILASPLSMAGVAATVADGRWRQPRLLADDPEEEGDPLPADRVATLRELMRSVVTSGTGTALAAVDGEPIGKSGTAEYGAGDPPPTHAWFIAARDGVAVSVLLEDRPSGGQHAAPIAARFFGALGE